MMSVNIDKTGRQIILSIYRYLPEEECKPKMVDYTVSTEDFTGKMLLDALESLRETVPDLGFRRSCGEGVCGSDGMNINGVNGLACITPLVELPDRVVLRPLPGFPVIRDLIVDMTQFYKQLERVKPYLKNNKPVPDKERIQLPADRDKLDGLYECILCACCTSACPSFWWNPDKFLGPAALLAAYRFYLDSRDTDGNIRLSALKDPFSLFRCRTIMNCVSVCPKGLNPAHAIGQLRQAVVVGGSDDSATSE